MRTCSTMLVTRPMFGRGWRAARSPGCSATLRTGVCARRCRLAGSLRTGTGRPQSADARGLSAVTLDSGTSGDKCLKRNLPVGAGRTSDPCPLHPSSRKPASRRKQARRRHDGLLDHSSDTRVILPLQPHGNEGSSSLSSRRRRSTGERRCRQSLAEQREASSEVHHV